MTADLFNCIGTPSGANTVTVDTSLVEFPDGEIAVFADGANVGFRFEDSAAPHDVFGSVEADSCLMLLSFLDDEGIYLNCFGTFDIQTGVMLGGCDSASVAEIPVASDPVILEDCDLDPILGVTLTIAPCP